jgi:hydrogenase maturation protein HypF
VGFRPHVYRQATSLGLTGWVRNDGAGVAIEVQGAAAALGEFVRRVRSQAPPLAHVASCELHELAADETSTGFEVVRSQAGRIETGVTADASVCPHCLSELFDPADRRYRYPFLNCTHCGPRYTLTAGLPYDRANTSMAVFAMCADCAAEYDAPQDRRFHAQPTACPACGPQVWLEIVDSAVRPLARGERIEAAPADPIEEALGLLHAGAVLAVKGLGGFHLVCDARNAEAVARLRARKQREEKPLAVMVANAASLTPFAEVEPEERALLDSRERPIVLLRKRAGCDERLAGIAPGVTWLGAMLPYTPLHYLLFHEAAGRPAGTAWLCGVHPLVLVMTSANPGGEPLVTGNREARTRLAGIADALLLHDREIVVRCDDSVVRWTGTATAFVRRARGYTPRAIPLARSGPSVLACGGWFKSTVCVTRGAEAFVSQHIGDLDNVATRDALEQAVEHLLRVLRITPERIAHDLHPDYYSTHLAQRFAAERGLPTVGVQHHHAHLAAAMAEHGLEGPALGLALDGVGLGQDGGIWGGELLRVEGAGFRRLGSLRPLALPGGDAAAREPWRMAASALHALGRGEEIAARFPGEAAAPVVAQMLERGFNCPPASSAGRLFDAAAGLLGVARRMRFEGQAAMLLEGLAEQHGPAAPLAEGYRMGEDGTLDLLPLLAALAQGVEAGRGAALFHATVVQALADWVARAAAEGRVSDVVLGGGCFLNHILSRSLRRRLAGQGLRVFEAQRLPPNDGGLSLGQAWVATRSE